MRLLARRRSLAHRTPIVIAIATCAGFILASAPGPLTAADATPAADAIAGVYKKRFKSGFVGQPGQPDQTVEVEDVIEIVRHDAGHIYFRLRLQFYNGHVCGLWGMAGAEAGGFVFREAKPLIPGQPACTLRISSDRSHLMITDRAAPEAPSTCSAYCGARGTLGDYKIERSRRRPIRYLPRLKASREYAEAVAALNAQPQGR